MVGISCSPPPTAKSTSTIPKASTFSKYQSTVSMREYDELSFVFLMGMRFGVDVIFYRSSLSKDHSLSKSILFSEDRSRTRGKKFIDRTEDVGS